MGATGREVTANRVMRQAQKLGRIEEGGAFAPYMLAHFASVAEPDTRTSVGAVFLVRTFTDWCERLDSEFVGGETLETVNRHDIARDVVSAVVPVWTVECWEVWADLCLWQWWTDRLDELGLEFELEGSLGELAPTVCQAVAEVLVEALFAALDVAAVKL